MKAIKTVVSIQDINNVVISKPIFEFYTFIEPTKQDIADKIKQELKIELEVRDCDVDNGGDFGLFFYYGKMYITYHYEHIEII